MFSYLMRGLLLLTVALLSACHPRQSTSGTIQWQPCNNPAFSHWFKPDAPSELLLCGYVEAPLVYADGGSQAHPGNSRTVRLAVTRLPATGERKGSVVMITGGPGAQGIELPLYPGDHKAIAALRQSYDIIGYDPRGVGQSTPKINCTLPKDKQPLPANIVDIAAEEQRAQEKVDACIQHTGLEVLQHISTNEAVNDLDVIRQALGESQLTAVAYSYGTKVAALYAERFPATTRALVLDGVVDLSEDGLSVWLNQGRSFQQTFLRFVEHCNLQGDYCPLGSGPEQATQRYQRLLNQIADQPLVMPSGRKITADDMLESTYIGLLWKEYWPDMMTTLRKIQNGESDKELEASINMLLETYDKDALMAIVCADEAQPASGDIRQQRSNRQKIIDAAPFSNFQQRKTTSRNECDLWPFPGKDQPHIPKPDAKLPPLLFIGQRYDAATPYRNAQAMAGWFNSPLITVEGDGHTLVLQDVLRCVDDAVVNYLLSPRQPLQSKTCQ